MIESFWVYELREQVTFLVFTSIIARLLVMCLLSSYIAYSVF
jgi:hypothetical protein